MDKMMVVRFNWKPECIGGSVHKLNFADTPQSAADLLLLPVSENKQTPDRHSTYGFDFDLFSSSARDSALTTKFCGHCTIGVGVMTSYRFSKMAATSSQICFRFQVC